MPLGPRRVGRRGVIGRPVARTAAVVGTTAVVAHESVAVATDATIVATIAATDAIVATVAERGSRTKLAAPPVPQPYEPIAVGGGELFPVRRAPHGRPVVVTGRDPDNRAARFAGPGADRVARPAAALPLWKEATTWANRSATSRQSSELVLRHERLLIACTSRGSGHDPAPQRQPLLADGPTCHG